MKKLVFLLPIAALAMASCSNDLVVEQPATKVVSANALQVYPDIQSVTRADGNGIVWDNSNFEKFYLTTTGKFQEDATTVNAAAGAAFNQALVTKSGSTWLINSKEWYWPSKNASSGFTAWAPVIDDYPTTKFLPGSYEASTTIANQKDILVAYNTGSVTDFESGVPLKFRHILSQIIVKADNAAKDKIQIKVKDVRLNNIITSGSWDTPTTSTAASDFVYDKWTPGASKANYLTGCGTSTAITLDGSAKDLTGAYPLLLIPQQLATANIAKPAENNGQYLSVLVEITDPSKAATDKDHWIFPKNDGTDAGGTTYAWAAVDINTLWEPGKKYIYTLHFTENGYGKVDGNTDGGNNDPTDPTPEDDTDDGNDPQPGDDIVDTPVKLILDVEVIDWVDGTTANESLDM